MIDLVDAATRTRMMSGIRSRNTRPERLLRSALHRNGLRFRLHRRDLPGRPDIVVPRYHAAIFVNGCFWHRHEGCRLATTPATRPEFWLEKFRRNVERDRRNESLLLANGWRVAIVWECKLSPSSVELTADALTAWLRDEDAPVHLDLGSP